MKSKIIAIGFLRPFLILFSCPKQPKFSVGYGYNAAPSWYDIAYKTDGDVFSYLEGVPITIGFGHYEAFSAYFCSEDDEIIQLSITGKTASKLEKSHVLYEVSAIDFCSDSFLIENTPRTGRKYNSEDVYEIPSFIFTFLKEERSQMLEISIGLKNGGDAQIVHFIRIGFHFIDDNQIEFWF